MNWNSLSDYCYVAIGWLMYLFDQPGDVLTDQLTVPTPWKCCWKTRNTQTWSCCHFYQLINWLLLLQQPVVEWWWISLINQWTNRLTSSTLSGHEDVGEPRAAGHGAAVFLSTHWFIVVMQRSDDWWISAVNQWTDSLTSSTLSDHEDDVGEPRTARHGAAVFISTAWVIIVCNSLLTGISLINQWTHWLISSSLSGHADVVGEPKAAGHQAAVFRWTNWPLLLWQSADWWITLINQGDLLTDQLTASRPWRCCWRARSSRTWSCWPCASTLQPTSARQPSSVRGLGWRCWWSGPSSSTTPSSWRWCATSPSTKATPRTCSLWVQPVCSVYPDGAYWLLYLQVSRLYSNRYVPSGHLYVQ